MRHRVKGRRLGRDKNHRKALFKSLVTSLVLHEEIKTTEAKAKAVKGLVDKLISRAKAGTLHSRRLLASFLPSQEAVAKLMDTLGPRFRDRASGFTRITRLGKRKGDQAPIVKMELMEKAEEKIKEKGEEKKKEKKKEEEVPAKKQTKVIKKISVPAAVKYRLPSLIKKPSQKGK